MVDRKELQIKIWAAVKNYPLAQIKNATPAQIATISDLTAEEIQVAKVWKNLIMFRLIKAKEAQQYTVMKNGIVVDGLVLILDQMVNDFGMDRKDAKQDLSNMLDELQEII